MALGVRLAAVPVLAIALFFGAASAKGIDEVIVVEEVSAVEPVLSAADPDPSFVLESELEQLAEQADAVPQRRHLRHTPASHVQHRHQHQHRGRDESEQVTRDIASLLDAGYHAEPHGGPKMYPASHPMVGRELDEMSSEVGGLHDQLQEVTDHRHHVEHAHSKAVEGMVDGVEIRRAMAARKAQMFVAKRLKKKLEFEAMRVQAQHDAVKKRLAVMMDPVVTVKGKQLEEEKADLEKTKAELEEVKKFSNEAKSDALESLKERKESYAKLEEAQANLTKAEQMLERSKDVYSEAQDDVEKRIEEYKIALTQVAATKSELTEEQNDVDLQQHSLDRSTAIYEMESHRLDHALEMSEKRIAKKEAALEQKMKSIKAGLAKAENRYKEWQTEQKKAADELAKRKAEFDKTSRDFFNNRLKVYKTAAQSAGEEAERESGFDNTDWAWSGDNMFSPDGRAVDEVNLG